MRIITNWSSFNIFNVFFLQDDDRLFPAFNDDIFLTITITITIATKGYQVNTTYNGYLLQNKGNKFGLGPATTFKCLDKLKSSSFLTKKWGTCFWTGGRSSEQFVNIRLIKTVNYIAYNLYAYDL